MLYVCVSVHVGGGRRERAVDVWVDIGVSGCGVWLVCFACVCCVNEYVC